MYLSLINEHWEQRDIQNNKNTFKKFVQVSSISVAYNFQLFILHELQEAKLQGTTIWGEGGGNRDDTELTKHFFR
jgi:hypothetical protein